MIRVVQVVLEGQFVFVFQQNPSPDPNDGSKSRQSRLESKQSDSV